MKVSFLSFPRSTGSRIALALVLLYAALLARPNLLFAKVINEQGLSLYSHSSSPEIARDLHRAAQRLAAAPLQPGSATHRLYLTQSFTEFRLLAPSSPHAFGVTYHLLQSSFLSPADPASGISHANRNEFNTRPLSDVIVHETTHAVLEEHFGAIRLLFIPSWKQEGYCEYVAGGATVGDDASGLHLLATHPPDAPALRYFQAYLRVKYLLETEHLTVDQLFASKVDARQADVVIAQDIARAAASTSQP